jgi:uncharacterized protein YbjT (DUF2867 family)
MELVTGATGYVGSRLVRRLVAEGRPVRALARRPELVTGVEVVRGDLLTGSGLEQTLEGCSTAYYLIHSMEPAAGNGSFAGRDREMATAFAEAAARAGVERIVYLGGIVPDQGANAPAQDAAEPGEDAAAPAEGGVPSALSPHLRSRLSPHLRSRLEVEEILLSAVPGSTALRASIVIGAGSSSFRILVRLVERLRVLPLPRWRHNRTQPIDERDVVEFLARTPQVPDAAGRALDVAGPDVVTYGDMIERIAEALGVGRLPLGFGRSLTPPASAVVAAVTGQPLELVRPLMESLETDLLPRDPEEAPRLYGVRPHSFRRALDHALAEWERAEPLGAR